MSIATKQIKLRTEKVKSTTSRDILIISRNSNSTVMNMIMESREKKKKKREVMDILDSHSDDEPLALVGRIVFE